LPRTEVTKRIWDYIKARNLQNPTNKRNVLCDAQLKAVMGPERHPNSSTNRQVNSPTPTAP